MSAVDPIISPPQHMHVIDDISVLIGRRMYDQSITWLMAWLRGLCDSFLHSIPTEVLNLCPWPRLKHWFPGNTAINCGLPRNRSAWHQHSQMTWHSRSFIMGPRLLNTWNINKNAWCKGKCVQQCGGKHAIVRQTGCKVKATFVYPSYLGLLNSKVAPLDQPTPKTPP